MNQDNRIQVEVQNQRGDVVDSYYVTPEQVEIAKKLSVVREKIAQEKLISAVDLLGQVCSEMNLDFFTLMENAKEDYLQQHPEEGTQDSPPMVQQESLLEEQGKQIILQQALEHGTTSICHQCRAFVASSRMKAHTEIWCDSLPSDEENE